MPSHPPLEATSSSLLPSPMGSVAGGHAERFSRQMRNPFGKSCALQPAPTLVSGDDGTFELTMCMVELGLIGQDALVEGSEPHDVGFESPVVGGPDGVEEGSVPGGGPLKGLMDPVRQWLRRVSCILGGCIDLAYVREVVRAILGGIPRHSTVVEL